MRHGTMSAYSVALATTPDEIREAQRLRWDVFVAELGARPAGSEPGLDTDRWDRWCDHLLVREDTSGELVGCYRMLPPGTCSGRTRRAATARCGRTPRRG